MSAHHGQAAVAAQAFTDRLIEAGMRRPAAEAKRALLRRVLESPPCGDWSVIQPSAEDLQGRPQAEPASLPPSGLYMLFVPGRIEVLGKHTDYAGGRSLLAAADRGFCVAATARADHRVFMVDVRQGRRVEFELHPKLAPTPGDWPAYPMTVGRRVARNFPGPLRGADIAFVSDLPPASGMSSSSALMIATFKVLDRINGLLQRPEARAQIGSPEDLAGYLATIENGRSFGSLTGDCGVGTMGGSEDHTAICCCRAGRLQLYSFFPTRQERELPMPPGCIFAIAYSGLAAVKTGGARNQYNRASQLVGALVDLWLAETGRGDVLPSHTDVKAIHQSPSLADIVRSAPDAAERLREIISRRHHASFDSAALLRRLEHFLGESERIIPAAADALGGPRDHDAAKIRRSPSVEPKRPSCDVLNEPSGAQLQRFGQLADESQSGAEQLLGNQVPQTVHLARSARRCGAVAASAFGAGFGGSVWALVEAATAESFLAEWAAQYRRAFPAEAEQAIFFPSGGGPGVVESAALPGFATE